MILNRQPLPSGVRWFPIDQAGISGVGFLYDLKKIGGDPLDIPGFPKGLQIPGYPVEKGFEYFEGPGTSIAMIIDESEEI